MSRDVVIERVAEAMAGADEWRLMGTEIRHSWRELARRAIKELRATHYTDADLVDDHTLQIKAGLVLVKHSGRLTTRRADSDTRQAIARDWVATLRGSGYVVIAPREPASDASKLLSGFKSPEP